MKIQYPDEIRERLATEIGQCLRGGCSATMTDDLAVYAGHDGIDRIGPHPVIHRVQAGRFRPTRANLLAAADEAIERAEEIEAYEQ
jgi:hypothetical protein